MPTLYNIPNVPGVPPVAFAPGFIQPVLLVHDIVSQFSAIFGPQWGIFLGGVPVITAESVTGFEFRGEWTISDYPVEGGQFESYDKVLAPYVAKVRLASGSTPQAREALLASVAAAAATLDLYDVVTPEFTYLSCSITHYDYRREAQRGVGLIVIDVWLAQVIQQNSGTLNAANAQNPSSSDPVQNGAVNLTSVDEGKGSGPPLQVSPPVDPASEFH